jgi:DNA-binding NtrC family response regulator
MVQHEMPDRGTVVLGRGKECDVAIEHSSVSRKHATLTIGDGYSIEDHGSSNGTRIDGREVVKGKPTPVAPGQAIMLGETRLVLPALPSSAAAGARPVVTIPAMALGPAMKALYATLDLVAKGKIPVLITGETGVGKDLLALELHRRSPRASQPFSTLACATFPEGLLETELFGFERGAFPGADQTKPGLVELADGGTLVLDEVAALSLATQAKLLRMLESGEVMRIGSLKSERIDLRVVATTNRSLEQLVTGGQFRSDLYYRLHGASLVIPPLRDRRTEIAPLARAFATAVAGELSLGPATITAPALMALERHDWPGNIRELKNVVERAVLLARGAPVGIEHVGIIAASSPALQANPSVPGGLVGEAPQPAGQSGNADLRTELVALERERIIRALAQCDGNQSQAAKLLGMPRRTLIKRLDAHQLPRPRKRVGEDPDDES